MCQALQVKVVGAQADYFFHEFHGADPRDFTHACRELAMGNPGFLPKLTFFRENVVTAREMRLEQERYARKRQDEQAMANLQNPIGQGHGQTLGHTEADRLFVNACKVVIFYGRADPPRALKLLDEILADPKLKDHAYVQNHRDTIAKRMAEKPSKREMVALTEAMTQ